MSEQLQNTEPLQAKAKERLQEELGSAKDNSFAEPVIEHLISRCDEDPGFAADVLQEGKSWANCYEFIYKMARKEAVNNRSVIRNDVVYEWAEDYYRMTPEQEKKASIPKPPAGAGKKAKAMSAKTPKASGNAQKASENAKKTSRNAQNSSENARKAEHTDKKPGSTGKPKNEIDGQMSLFDLL